MTDLKKLQEHIRVYCSKDTLNKTTLFIEKIKKISVTGYEYEWKINDKEVDDFEMYEFIGMALMTPEVQKVFIEKIKEIWAEVSK